jgi:hypothetical protein
MAFCLLTEAADVMVHMAYEPHFVQLLMTFMLLADSLQSEREGEGECGHD